MQISLKWVNELVTVQGIDLDDLITKLTLGGFEVEEIIEISNQKIITLDISTTANRSDSLSIQGFSLELAALLNQAPKLSQYSKKTFSGFNEFQSLTQSSLKNPDCSGFIGLLVKNLTNLSSPKWLQQKLSTSGIVPENNLTDFQNYILVETGYPFEFYDLTKIISKVSDSNFDLELTYSKEEQKFRGKNDLVYQLDPSILLLKANHVPISIAGISSDPSVIPSDTTNALLIEGSIWNAPKIRQQSRRVGLRTDRSARYEKSLKNINLLASVYRVISLLRIENPNLICELHTFTEPKKEQKRRLSLNYQNVKQILGPTQKLTDNTFQYISPTKITDTLIRLSFEVDYDSKNLIWNVTIPPLRSDDISQEIDLIEEVGRIYGFDNFCTRLPKIKTVGTEDIDYKTRKKLTNCLINLGWNELVQYSLTNQKTYLQNEIKLINPLVKDYSHLRGSLLPNLVKALEENIKKGNSILEGFEYGHVFSQTKSNTILEQEYISGIFGGTKVKSNWSKPTELVNWFEAKGKIDFIFQKLNVKISWKNYSSTDNQTILHPYRTGEIIIENGTQLGVFGQMHPRISKQLCLPSDIYLFEFNFEKIKQQIETNKITIYESYSAYPKIVKDLSFVVNENVSFQEIQKLLYLNGSQFLIDVTLLDEYLGESIPKYSTSLCLQLTFQSQTETLMNTTIENIIQNLTKLLHTKFNIILR